ncbi:asparaginase, partial [Tessaracoccus lubricantis]
EGTLALGLADGTGIGIKVSDGRHRATVPVAVAILAALGHSTATLSELDPEPVLGHGERVGQLVPAAPLVEALRLLG